MYTVRNMETETREQNQTCVTLLIIRRSFYASAFLMQRLYTQIEISNSLLNGFVHLMSYWVSKCMYVCVCSLLSADTLG